VLNGCYVESEADEHVILRERLLRQGTRLSPLPLDLHVPPGELPVIAETGLVVFDFGDPLDDTVLVALGDRLGEAMSEAHESVQPFVDRGVILNLVTQYADTSNVDLQPFATNFIALHTESSGRRLEEQPRFIVLMCVEPGDEATNAQTVVVPMDGLVRKLAADELSILSRTRYRHNVGVPIVRDVAGRQVFCFRDFMSDELMWTYAGEDRTEDEVNGAIRALLRAVYSEEAAFGVTWRRGMIVVIDNTFFFHGRTAGTATSERPRHLKRLRILSRNGEVHGR